MAEDQAAGLDSGAKSGLCWSECTAQREVRCLASLFSFGISLLISCALCLATCGQERSQSSPQTDSSALGYKRIATEESIRDWIDQLVSPSYRAREFALWQLKQHPRAAVPVIAKSLPGIDHHTGALLIELLTDFAVHKDVEISIAALNSLEAAAQQMSSIGKLAKNAMLALSDIQEEQAIEILLHHDAIIGPPNFHINAQLESVDGIALHINENFSGDDEAIQWIHFLKSIDTVFLEGPNIDSRYFKAISKLKQVRNIKLRGVDLKPADLELFRQFENLEHLGINYVDIGDWAVRTLSQLAISESMRLYGTGVSDEGAAYLERQLEGIEFYWGRGGFLGVAMERSNTLVTFVTPNSGANIAGIRIGDQLRQIDGNSLKNFFDLREELGKRVPGDKISVLVERAGEEFELEVVLTEEPR